MSDITAAAASRLEGLRGDGPAATAINALGTDIIIRIDHGDHTAHIPASGPSEPEQNTAEPTVTLEISSEDVLALADGDLDVVQAVTQRRLHADGPIFAALGVAHAITTL
ncbi:SCP2 sterol-binding domain-containing protein [Corynebacterium sp. AOP12-C2-36]|uniref:SCP2 sterol-binding domain-containing protein n=1 Tax=Corynebacterium sp. AOP12-C2-36 TaxID=3457723 RepID=UPI00403432C5